MAAGFWGRLLALGKNGAQEEGEDGASARRTENGETGGKEVRRHYYFSGRVQAVGFRYTAYRTANRMGLTGWVENLEDGRVEMEVQGQAGTIDLFLQQLQTGGRILIEEMEQEERPLCTENDFWVRG